MKWTKTTGSRFWVSVSFWNQLKMASGVTSPSLPSLCDVQLTVVLATAVLKQSNNYWLLCQFPLILVRLLTLGFHSVVKMIVHRQLEYEPWTTRFIGSFFMLSELLKGRPVPSRPLFAQIPLWGPRGIPDSMRFYSARMVQIQRARKADCEILMSKWIARGGTQWV
jgi:hypothetical protein